MLGCRWSGTATAPTPPRIRCGGWRGRSAARGWCTTTACGCGRTRTRPGRSCRTPRCSAGSSPRPSKPRNARGWVRSPRSHWCRRARTRGGPTGTGSTRCRAAVGAGGWVRRGSGRSGTTGSRCGSPATGSPCAERAGVRGEGRGPAGGVVAAVAVGPVVVHGDPGGRRPVLRVVRRRPRRRQPLPPTSAEVGVDLGLDRLAVTSDGEIVDNPRHLRRKARALARAQRALARKQCGSANRRKAGRRVAVLHRRVRETRLDASPQAGPAAGPRQPSGPPGETCPSPVWPGRNWPGRSTMRAGPRWSG